ncbi:hypothetical protein AC578_1735 [Pseudocercospora eumusae]|uniref:Oxidase ustYa n=1 Tax=Pseudocercospora eumusae TaxID=321146 RepID=A0A139H030_9PEZI|nr:hypothetical protein AC578_1735 [Pseudocercospora eumusae]
MARSKSDEEQNILLTDAENHENLFKSAPSQDLDWKSIAIAALLLLNLGLVAEVAWQTPKQLLNSYSLGRKNGLQSQKIARVPDLPLKPVMFHWNTPYSSMNDTEADVLWDAINTAHGHIAVDHAFAKNNQWTASMSLPDDPDRGLYLLESYHQLHCLKIVRRVFLESLDDKPLSWPVQHARHCFDYFRQFIMCHADNTPLYTQGKHTSGDGQVHMCRDWSALRDYATERSACFRDRLGQESLSEQFGHCDDGTDGLEDTV